VATANPSDLTIIAGDRSAVKRCAHARSLSTVPGSPLCPLTGRDLPDSVRPRFAGTVQEPCQAARTGLCTLARNLQGGIERKKLQTLAKTFQQGKPDRCDSAHKRK